MALYEIEEGKKRQQNFHRVFSKVIKFPAIAQEKSGEDILVRIYCLAANVCMRTTLSFQITSV